MHTSCSAISGVRYSQFTLLVAFYRARDYSCFGIYRHSFAVQGHSTASLGLCPGVPVHRGNNYCTPLFTSLCLAVAYCWVYCIGSCLPVHEDRTISRYISVNFLLLLPLI